MCQNIEDFNRGCALILGVLYRSFPRPVVISMESLDNGEDLLPECRAERMLERRAVYAATVQFLADEGYLIFASKAGPETSRSFSMVRLTSKGLATLNRVPDSLRPPSKTIGDSLVDFGKDAITGSVKDFLKQTIGAVFTIGN